MGITIFIFMCTKMKKKKTLSFRGFPSKYTQNYVAENRWKVEGERERESKQK